MLYIYCFLIYIIKSNYLINFSLKVEGKIKALKRDYKQIKFDKAIPAVQHRMAPYLERLDKIFSREEL